MFDAVSALGNVDGQPARRRLLVLVARVRAGLTHGGDDLVQRHVMVAVASERHSRGVGRVHCGDRVAFDAGRLYEADNDDVVA